MIARALRIPSDLAALPALTGLVDAFSLDIAADPFLRFNLHLVVEELSVNAIVHGYGDARDGWIAVRLRQTPDGAEVAVEDGAPPFDPLAAPQTLSASAVLEDRDLGGLGLTLLRHAAASLRYERVLIDGALANRTVARLRAAPRRA